MYQLDLTPQEARDKMKAYFTQEGSVLSHSQQTGLCEYRTKVEGKVRACAVGCLIPDEEYLDAMEGNTVSCLVYGGRLGMGEETLAFLVKAQTAHDGFDDVADFLEWLDKQ